MVIEQMTVWECRELLARTHLARLACALDNQPYIVPIDVDYYDGFLYGLSMEGQKIDWMRSNPLVCVAIDELTTRRQWESVIVFGRYDELAPNAAHANARSIAERLFQRHPVWWEPATVPLAGRDAREPILFRILVNRMTGRRARLDLHEATHDASEASQSRRARWLSALSRWLGSRCSGWKRSGEERFSERDEGLDVREVACHAE